MEKKRNWLLPASILVAALLISISLVYNAGRRGESGTASLTPSGNEPRVGQSSSINNIRPVSTEDHIFGNPNAPVKVVEFSDLECPFCNRFHPTMKQVVADYDGEVAWVYRHFPLDSIHAWARPAAEASECTAALGGNDVFWSYLDEVFVVAARGGFSQSVFGELAVKVGLSKSQFEACLSSGAHKARVEQDLQDAVNSGGRGTPYSVVIAPNGEKLPISGAQPLGNVKAVIDQALNLE